MKTYLKAGVLVSLLVSLAYGAQAQVLLYTVGLDVNCPSGLGE